MGFSSTWMLYLNFYKKKEYLGPFTCDYIIIEKKIKTSIATSNDLDGFQGLSYTLGLFECGNFDGEEIGNGRYYGKDEDKHRLTTGDQVKGRESQ